MNRYDNAPAAVQELLAADTVLPEQFWNPGSGARQSGERALMWAVFTESIESYRRYANAGSVELQIDFLDAERWLMATDWDWPFSFVNLCEVFGLDPVGVRRRLVLSKEAHPDRRSRRQRFRPVALRAA